ncbi:hypothetical protein [Paraburkholderia xenovorans]
MIEAVNPKYGFVQTTDEIHFTGGIRGHRAGGGWNIGPILNEGKLKHFGPVPDAQIRQVANDLGVTLLGINEIVFDDPNLPSHIWHTMLSQRSNGFSAADAWSAISSQARIVKDHDYADLARNVSASLRAADIRLRDASDEYHRQLVAGLVRGAVAERRFANIALSDLHLAFHSLLAEMGAARDYLSAIVGRHVNAPKKTDSLARLINWVEKDANFHLSNHPLLSPLFAGWSESEPNRWLFDLGEYRNTFLHREPFGVNGIERGVAIFVAETRFGFVHTLKLDIPIRPDANEKVEALNRFVQLYGHLLMLAKQIGDNAKYSSTPISFVARQS